MAKRKLLFFKFWIILNWGFTSNIYETYDAYRYKIHILHYNKLAVGCDCLVAYQKDGSNEEDN